MSTAASYVALTKPRILPLVLFSGLPALMIASGGWPSATLTLSTLLGTALCAAAASALNSYLERDRDAKMERTRGRPLPSGEIRPAPALAFGLALGAAGTLLLWAWSGAVAAGIAVASIAVYIFAYTIWLKPRTPFAVVVGGFSGAIAPLIADAAVDGHVGMAGWLLFSIVFVWQPPHFYAIALFRRDDYARAGFPMLPDRIGEDATYSRILAWSAVLVPLTFLPALLPGLGAIYLVAAAAFGGLFVRQALRLRARRDLESARGLFLVSLLQLLGLFGAMIVELAIGRVL